MQVLQPRCELCTHVDPAPRWQCVGRTVDFLAEGRTVPAGGARLYAAVTPHYPDAAGNTWVTRCAGCCLATDVRNILQEYTLQVPARQAGPRADVRSFPQVQGARRWWELPATRAMFRLGWLQPILVPQVTVAAWSRHWLPIPARRPRVRPAPSSDALFPLPFPPRSARASEAERSSRKSCP